jgi:hypothetical protein
MNGPAAKITVVAEFPKGSFVENLVVRSDNSMLVSIISSSELWFVPAPKGAFPVQPYALHTFDNCPLAMCEVEPDVFYLCVSDIYTTHESHLVRIDLRGWTPGQPIEPETVLDFPGRVRGLNGACLIAPRVMLVADCFAGLIWRVDIPKVGPPSTDVWLSHESMGYFPGTQKPEQPGVNGLGYAAKTGFVYYTATAKKLLMRVPVDPTTLMPSGEPEHVTSGRVADDFCIDEDAGVLYMTTHRENTVDRVSLDPAGNAGEPVVVAGNPFDSRLMGPSSGRWRRGDGDYGKAAYFIADGGRTAPVPGVPIETAKLLLLEL